MTIFKTYLISFFLMISFGFIILRRLVPRDYLKYGKLSHLTTVIQSLLFFVYGGFPYIYLNRSWPQVYVPRIFHAFGLLLVFAGLASLFYGMFKLGVIRSIGQGKTQLIKSGLYRFTRNPQAIACGTYVIGFFMLWPSWYAGGWVLLYPILIHMMVLAEEDHLKRIHGEEYEEYCQGVPRYLGIITKVISADP